MATPAQALKKMRDICLAFPGATEGGHFGQTAFYVKKKLFATVGEKHGACEITFGLELEHAEALVKKDTRFSHYPRDRRGVVIDAANVKDWAELKGLLAESYAIRSSTKPKTSKTNVRAKKR